MRQWIGLIIVLAGAYYVWANYGHKLGETYPPATPDVAWYQEEIEHHFAIVPGTRPDLVPARLSREHDYDVTSPKSP